MEHHRPNQVRGGSLRTVRSGRPFGAPQQLRVLLRAALLTALAVVLTGCPGLLDWPPTDRQIPPPSRDTVDSRSFEPDTRPGGPDGVTATPDVQLAATGNFPNVAAALVIGNLTGEDRIVRLRHLRPTVQLDCDAIAAAPQQALRPLHFAAAKSWLVRSGRAVPVLPRNQGTCTAVLIDGTGLPPRLLFWRNKQLPLRQLPSLAQSAKSSGRLIAIQAEEGAAVWGQHAARFGALKRFDPVAPPGCALPDGEADLTWTALPGGDQTLVDLLTAPDGCSALDLLTDLGMKRAYICVPPGMLPFKAGEDLYIAGLTTGHNVLPLTGAELLSDLGHLRMGRGNDLVYFGKGEGKITQTPGCPALHDGAGTYGRALSVIIEQPGKSAFQLNTGATLDLEAGGRLHLVRAMERLVWDTAVAAKLSGTRHIESVWSKQ